MPERLESRLAELAREVEYPPTPELAAAVRRRIAAGEAGVRRRRRVEPGEPRRLRFPRSRRALALAIALALLGGAGAAAAVPAVRDALGDLLGLRGASVRRVPRLPPAPATAARDLGPRVSFADARRSAGFAIVLARDRRLGAPGSVHLARAAGGGARVTLVYRDGDVTLTELRGSTAPDLVRKLTPRSTPVRRVVVRGEPGLYIGGPHAVLFRDARGQIVADRARTAGPALLWQRGPLLLRLQARVGADRALQIARSVR